MKIQFDNIHTQKKQLLLKEMMTQINKTLAKEENHNLTLTGCPICSSKNIHFFVKAFEFNMSICDECGLIFCNPYPTDKQLYMYYNSEMKSFENEFFKESFEHRVNLFLPRVKLIEEFKTSGNLLDIGSAIGVFIEALHKSEAKFKITCCDMSKEACLELKAKYQEINTINDNFLNLPISEKFDIITMWDTLEHIVDQNELIKKISNLLNKNGIFVFSTPNTNSFEWNIARDKHVQILPPGHVNLMNEKNISILLANHNMKILHSATPNASLDIGYVKKLIQNKQVNDLYIGNYLKNKIFDENFENMLEKYLIENKQAGNIVVVARNNNDDI